MDSYKKTIGASQYEVTLLPAKKGAKVLAKLPKLQGIVSGGISDEDLDFLCDTFAATTQVLQASAKGVMPLKDVFDLHFSGKYSEMLQWVAFCVEVNFKDFFPAGLGDMVAGALTKVSESLSQKASTGLSGV